MKKQEELKVLYTDNHLVVVEKPAGMLVQGDSTGDETLLDITKQYIKEKYNKPGDVYLGLVHRLDRPSSGVIVFAKTSKAASRLTDQFKNKQIKKKYLALVQGMIPRNGSYEDYLYREEKVSKVSRLKKGDFAELSFKQLAFQRNVSLAEIDLKTGRHHQIRVQFASRGNPILGDFLYGSKEKFPWKTIGLHALSITLTHPTTKEKMTFSTFPGRNWPHFFQEFIEKKY